MAGVVCQHTERIGTWAITWSKPLPCRSQLAAGGDAQTNRDMSEQEQRIALLATAKEETGGEARGEGMEVGGMSWKTE